MKGIFTFFISITLTSLIYAQSPQTISYQAVIRDANSELITDQTVGIQISILQGSPNGTEVYSETQTPVSNKNGLISLEIGTGSTTDDFSLIDWQKGPYFLKTEVDPAGGANYVISGTTQLLSVPYSLYSTTAEKVVYEKQTLSEVLDQMNSAHSQIKDVMSPTEDHDAVNREFVTLGISETGDTLFMGKDQYVIIPGISAANYKVPTVINMGAEVNSPTIVKISANIIDNGFDEISGYGFEYSTDSGFVSGSGIKVLIEEPLEEGLFSTEIDSLSPGETYYFKPFSTNSKGTSYGEKLSFTSHAIVDDISPFYDKISTVIGSGYNVTTTYATSSGVLSSVLDFDRMADSGLVQLDKNQILGQVVIATGSTMTSYQSDIRTFAEIDASHGAFKGEIKLRFDQQKTGSNAYSFATESSKQVLNAFVVDRNYRLHLSRLRPYILQSFKTEIMTMVDSMIWITYGTDVLLGGMWGGRADYNLTARKKSAHDGSNIGAYVKARYDAVLTQGGGTVDVDKKFSSDFETSSVEERIVSRGGSTTIISNKDDFAAWQQSINAGNEVFIEYYPSTVIPIYEFIEDSVRKAHVKAARAEYLRTHEIQVDPSATTEAVSTAFEEKGFTSHESGDKEMNSKSGRNTILNATITLTKTASNKITCSLFLDVKEEHSDNTEFKGKKSFEITTEHEILDFSPITFTLSQHKVEGSQHDWVDLQNQVHNQWLTGFNIQFDSMHSDDGPAIGMKGKINLNVKVRDSF